MKIERRAALFAIVATLLLSGKTSGEGPDVTEAAPVSTQAGTLSSPPREPSAINAAEAADRDLESDSTSREAQAAGFEPLGGNLPKIIEDPGKPYLVTSDVYVPPGKTIRIEPGVVLLFRNFTGMHIEGRLVAEGTPQRPIVFSSEFDKTFNHACSLHANPYDWNGITIHENGLGSSFANVRLQYSVFGINSLTKYFKLDKLFFSNNGRSDLVIEGKDRTVAQQPVTYGLTIDDARKDGVPVKILMDPRAKKRNLFRYLGVTLLVGGCGGSIASFTQYQHDRARVAELSNSEVKSEHDILVANEGSDWEKARSRRNLDLGIAVFSSCLTILGGVGFGYSFTF